MTAPVERRHRELAFRSRYPWVGEVPAHMASWLHGDDFFHHHDPEGLSLNSIAQALADIEAPLLAEVERLAERDRALQVALAEGWRKLREAKAEIRAEAWDLGHEATGPYASNPYRCEEPPK